MFIENPNKKTAYSFRVKPKLLEDIKLYAKATHTTVPELLNEMIEDKVRNVHLTNSYLDATFSFNGVINLPSLTDMYNDGEYKEFDLLTKNTTSEYYEIQQIPNNLDIWTDDKGYTSNTRGVIHEGISFLLAPELITDPEYLKNSELSFCCLVPIYFEVYNVNPTQKKIRVNIKNISLKNAFEKINQASDTNLLDDFTQFNFTIKQEIKRFKYIFWSAEEKPDGSYYAGGTTYSDEKQLLEDLYCHLILNLEKYCKEINTNIVRHEDKVVERITEEESNKDTLENTLSMAELREELKEKDKAIDELQSELNKVLENQDSIVKMLKEYEAFSSLINSMYKESDKK